MRIKSQTIFQDKYKRAKAFKKQYKYLERAEIHPIKHLVFLKKSVLSNNSQKHFNARFRNFIGKIIVRIV